MKALILRMSRRAEAALVLLLAFGITVPKSLWAAVSPDYLAKRTTPPITNEALHHTVMYELGVMMILIPFLWARGWSRERLGIRPTVGDSIWGLGLVVGYSEVSMVLVT